MKNIRLSHSVAALAVTLLLNGCGNKLDIAPTQSIDQSQALTTSKDVEATLIGAYDGLGSYYVWGGQIQMVADLLADDREIAFGGTFVAPGEFYDKSILTTNLFAEEIWTDSYYTINVANNVLGAIDKVETAKKGRVEGEALFIRASLYFELVRLFAKAYNDGTPASNPGVPLVLTATRNVDDASFVRRNTVAEVYTQILADLTKAESLLPATNGLYASKGAAAAMLSRVYLQQGNYASARDAANRVITSNRYALNQFYEQSFNNINTNTPENIFSTQVTSQDGTNSLQIFYSLAPGGRGDIEILTKHLQQYEAADERQVMFYQSGGQIFNGKNDEQFANVPIIRLAEMYLTRAEANLRLGTSVGATPLEDVNRVRARVALAPLTATTLTVNAILRERKLELMFEGHLLHDLKRTGRTIGSIPFNANRLVLPIPQREIDANKSLVQNAGY
jgi:tetratricopeptide (TPR) repeat protein